MKTKDEYEREWAERINLPFNKFKELGIRARKCDCNFWLCCGWVPDFDTDEIKLHDQNQSSLFDAGEVKLKVVAS